MFDIWHTSSNKSLTFLLIYRKNNSNVQEYIQSLFDIIQSNTIHVILGDFNINHFIDNSLLHQLSSLQYIQIVNESTFISSGSLLDQVFVKQPISDKCINEVISVYYSDHECVKITIKM